jgi:translation elongation factor EF-1alpha
MAETKKKAAEKEKKAEGKEIGRVSGYFSHVGVAAIKLTDKLKVGDKIRIKGHTTEIEQKVDSMQIENKPVKDAKKGDHIGIKVSDKVRPNDKVFLVK